jgi:hypothetical protein
LKHNEPGLLSMAVRIPLPLHPSPLRPHPPTALTLWFRFLSTKPPV